MKRPALGQVCVELGFLQDAQVEEILRDMRENRQGRFGELAVGMNLLSQEQLAQALARQFGLPLLSSQRLEGMSVPREVLNLLPVQLMRARVVLPTFLEPDRRTLSLVTSDPTDLPTLQAAQRHARAERLRLFIAASSALSTLLDRLLPASTAPIGTRAAPSSTQAHSSAGGTVVLETDVEIASALRRLDRAEGGRAQVVQDPEQVTAILRAGLADRVLYREILTDAAAAYVPVWRSARPGVQVARLRGFSPSRRVAVGYRAARDFYQQLLLWLLTTATQSLPEREKVRESWRLASELGRELGLAEEQIEAVTLVALSATVNDIDLDADSPEHSDATDSLSSVLGNLERPSDLLSRFSPPWDISGLFAALDLRLNRPGEVGEHLAVEVLLALRHAINRGVLGKTDAADVLDPRGRYHPRVRSALTHVLQRRVLRAQLLSGGRRRAIVVAALTDPVQVTDVEQRLEAAGFEVLVSLDADQALADVRAHAPSAVVVAGDLPADGARRLLAEIRHDSPIADTLVLMLGPASDPDAVAALRPDVFVPSAVDLARMERELRMRAPASGPAPDRTATATGDTRLLPIEAVVGLLSGGRQTAAIQIASTSDQGTVHIVEGRLHSARLGSMTGEEAWLEIQGIDQGRYAVTFGKRPDDQDRSELLGGAPD